MSLLTKQVGDTIYFDKYSSFRDQYTEPLRLTAKMAGRGIGTLMWFRFRDADGREDEMDISHFGEKPAEEQDQ